MFNAERTIERTLVSVLTQSFSLFEVIVVNDGSSDNSLNLLEKYLIDPRVKIINQGNKGVSVARNCGVKNAKYNYIAFLDSDDEILPYFLLEIKNAIELFPEAGIYGCSSTHRNLINGNSSDGTINIFRDKILSVNIFNDLAYLPHSSAIVINRSKYYEVFPDGNGFPVGMKVCEDWSCYLRFAYKFKIIYIGIPLAIRNNGVVGQITGNKKIRSQVIYDIINFYNTCFRFWFENENENENIDINRFLKHQLRARILYLMNEGEFESLFLLINNLDSRILSLMQKFEIKLYLGNNKYFAILFIYFTKILWRIEKICIPKYR